MPLPSSPHWAPTITVAGIDPSRSGRYGRPHGDVEETNETSRVEREFDAQGPVGRLGTLSARSGNIRSSPCKGRHFSTVDSARGLSQSTGLIESRPMATNGARTDDRPEPQVPPQNLDAEESRPRRDDAVARPRSPPSATCSRRTGASSTARATRRSSGRRSRSTPRASRSTRSRSSTSSTSAASSRTSAARSASTSWRRSCPRARNAGHYAQIVKEAATLRGLIRVGGEIARLGWERPGETRRARRPGRADPLRALPGEGDLGVQPHRDAPEGELRAHHAAVRVRARTSPASPPASATSTGSPPGSRRGT